MPQIIQIVVSTKQRKEIAAMAKKEKRSLSNMAGYLLVLGQLKYRETDVQQAQAQAEVTVP